MATTNPIGFGSPFLAPDVLRQRLALQQNQRYANALMQQGAQTPQGQMVSGHYVAPSWSQYLANGLKTAVGRSVMNHLPSQEADIRRKALGRMLGRFNLGGVVDNQPGAGTSQPDVQTFPVGPSGTSQQPPVPQSRVTPQQLGQVLAGKPMTLPGLTVAQSRNALLTLGPQEYMKRYTSQFSPTQDQRNLSFLPKGQRNRLIEGQYLQKATDDGTQRVLGADGRIYAVPVPGYAPAQAALQGGITNAEEGAKANYDLVSVPDGRGGSITMPRSQAVARLKNSGATAQGTASGQGQLGVKPSPADTAYETELAKGSAATYNKYQTAAQSAGSQIASYKRIGDLLKGYQGGSLSNFGVQVGKLANSIGWHDFDPKLPDKEAAMAIGNQLALQLRGTANGGGMPGSMSDADRNFLVASTPNLAQTAEGRQKLINYQIKVLERQQDVAQAARKWRAKYGRLDALDAKGDDFQTNLQQWADAHPLFGNSNQDYSNLWGG